MVNSSSSEPWVRTPVIDLYVDGACQRMKIGELKSALNVLKDTPAPALSDEHRLQLAEAFKLMSARKKVKSPKLVEPITNRLKELGVLLTK